MKCPKCGGEMEEGELRPQLGNLWWVPKNLSGLGKKSLVVYRCKNCGYLESYAK